MEFNLILAEKTQALNIAITLSEPTNGIAVSNIDFPLILKTIINQSDPVARVDFYYLTKNSDEPNLITSIAPVETKEIISAWKNIPTSNTYTIYSQAKTWTKQTIKSNEISIVVNNIEEESQEE